MESLELFVVWIDIKMFQSLVWLISLAIILPQENDAFTIVTTNPCFQSTCLFAGGGFGATGKNAQKKKKNKKKTTTGKGKGNLIQTMNDETSPNKKKKKNKGTTYNKSEQELLLEQLAASAAENPIGRVVAEHAASSSTEVDPFWELMPSLISSKFPSLQNNEMERLAGFVKYALNPCEENLEQELIEDEWRTTEDIHAFMPGLGPTQPFHDPSMLELCAKMSANVDIIEKEYEALVQDHEDKFQSVTSMNYDAGWKTLVLFYNGHRIENFPYHLCPVTTSILESVPLAGRIAGFNRQQPISGIPNHTDGNNMWLTCQMGIKVPTPSTSATITVGPETRHWERGQCLLYDTTYRHETFNAHPTQERIVLHVDFFNTLTMTPQEIEVLQYIYSIREQFMKAEGVAKVGAQVL